MLIGCSGWSYADSVEKGGWTKVFYPNAETKKLQYYSEFFNTAEMDATFYEKFYKYMTKETFVNMTKATPDNFQFSVKVPETVTHDKRLDVNKGAITHLEEFLDKISPIKNANKLGAVLIQLPPSFTVKEFTNTFEFAVYETLLKEVDDGIISKDITKKIFEGIKDEITNIPDWQNKLTSQKKLESTVYDILNEAGNKKIEKNIDEIIEQIIELAKRNLK